MSYNKLCVQIYNDVEKIQKFVHCNHSVGIVFIAQSHSFSANLLPARGFAIIPDCLVLIILYIITHLFLRQKQLAL